MTGATSRRTIARLLIGIEGISCGGCVGRAAPPEDATSASAQESTSSSQASSSHTTRNFGWAGLGIGADAAIVAVGTSFVILHDKSVRDGNCNAEKVCSPSGLAANEDIATLADWNTGAWILAALGIGIGGILLLTDHAGSSQHAAITVHVGSGADLGIESSF
jgi:hypothetical protein